MPPKGGANDGGPGGGSKKSSSAKASSPVTGFPNPEGAEPDEEKSSGESERPVILDQRDFIHHLKRGAAPKVRNGDVSSGRSSSSVGCSIAFCVGFLLGAGVWFTVGQDSAPTLTRLWSRWSPEASECPRCPVLEAPDCPTCPVDAGDSETCKAQLPQMSAQLKTLREELSSAQTAVAKEAAESKALRAQLAQVTAELEELRHALSSTEAKAAPAASDSQGVEVVSSADREAAGSPGAAASTGEASWPECVQRGVVLRGEESGAAILVDVAALLGDAASGCRLGDCSATDRVKSSKPEECARLCGALATSGCRFWSLGERDGEIHCFFRSKDAGRTQASDAAVAASVTCQPPPSTISPVKAALAVANSAALKACDADAGGKYCPDLHDAMRTWFYGIRSLRAAFQGSSPEAMAYVEQIAADAEAFISLPAGTEQLQEFYLISAANNRQVFDLFRGLLESAEPEEAAVSRTDVSAPRPARGLFCRGAENECSI